MKLGYFTAPPGVTSFIDFMDIAKSHDLHSIELYGTRELAPNIEFDKMVQSAKAIKEHAQKTNTAIACFSMYADIVGEKRKETLEMLKKYAQICQITGCPYLHHTIAIQSPDKINMPLKEYLRRAVESIREIYDYSEQLGVKCCYEDQGYVFNGCDRFELLISEVNRDIGIVADVGNIMFADETPEQFVGRFIQYIVHVHLKDYLYKSGDGPNPGERWHRTRGGNYLRDTIIGHGAINFEKVFALLINANYGGHIHLECSSLENPEIATRLNYENARRYYENAQRSLGKK